MKDTKKLIKETKKHGHSATIAITEYAHVGDNFEVTQIKATGQIILTPVEMVKS